MVTIQPQTVSKEKTVKQIVLINNLLQSRYFSKAEFEKYKTLELKTIKTSYEASLVIAELIAKLRFRKKFNSKRCKAHLRCDYCGSKEKLSRFFNVAYLKQRVLCEKCELKKEEFDLEQQEAEDNISKILQSQMDSDFEDKEASADLYRKYEYGK